MSEASQSARYDRPHTFSFARVLLLAVPLALVGWWAASNYGQRVEEDTQANLEQTMFTRLLGAGAATQLDARYTDADGDLVADPPKDESKLADPKEINFSYIASSDTEGAEQTWKEFVAALEKQLDRKVNFIEYSDVDEQIRALKEGQLHVTAFSTGEAQDAVNQAGFVPAACFADEDGNYHYQMKIIVPAESSIKSLADLAPTESDGKRQKHRVTFVRPTSNSGCTAALVTLVKEQGLQPERDYNWGFSYGHENSIKWVAEKKTDAAPVASDMLERMIAGGEIDGDAVRAIYESEKYPGGVIGYAHNLTPELRDAIRETLVNFQWEGTGLEKTYGPAGDVKFAPVSYKEDWAAVRKLNESGVDLASKNRKPAA